MSKQGVSDGIAPGQSLTSLYSGKALARLLARTRFSRILFQFSRKCQRQPKYWPDSEMSVTALQLRVSAAGERYLAYNTQGPFERAQSRLINTLEALFLRNRPYFATFPPLPSLGILLRFQRQICVASSRYNLR